MPALGRLCERQSAAMRRPLPTRERFTTDGVVKVAPPLTERQAARIEPLGLLADEPSGLLEAWNRVEILWSEAVEQAHRLPPGRLDARVNGQWSFIETLRHLVFVSDAWIGEVIQEHASPYDPIGLPPDFIANGKELGLDLDARPSLADVLDVRAHRIVEVRAILTHTTLGELDRRCSRFDGRFTVLGAFQNVIFEEWAHHYYAIRDLVSLG
jgi:DinB superfamily